MPLAQAFFLEHIDDDTDECIIWPFHTNRGYGYIHWGKKGQTKKVHRLALELTVGPCPDGMQAAHSCHEPACFNPRHLRWATPKENMADRAERGTTARGERIGIARLNRTAVADIRRRRTEGETLVSLAAEYGVHHSTILRAARGDTW